jgi:hypothetical protein
MTYFSSTHTSVKNLLITRMRPHKNAPMNSNVPFSSEIRPGMKRHTNGTNNFFSARNRPGQRTCLPDSENKPNNMTAKPNRMRSWKPS